MGLRPGRDGAREDGQADGHQGRARAAQARQGDRRDGVHGQARQRVHRHGAGRPQLRPHRRSHAVGEPGEEEQDQEAGRGEAACGVRRREERPGRPPGAPAPAEASPAAPP